MFHLQVSSFLLHEEPDSKKLYDKDFTLHVFEAQFQEQYMTNKWAIKYLIKFNIYTSLWNFSGSWTHWEYEYRYSPPPKTLPQNFIDIYTEFCI